MKKIAILLTVFSLLLPTNVFAEDRIDLTLPKTVSDEITIDGENKEYQWQSAQKLTLTKENTGTWQGLSDEEHILPLDAYIMWSDEGIYVYADITDNDPTFDGVSDCFEISFNPGGIIPKEDKLQGMFFMFFPQEDGTIRCTRHNMDEDTTGGIDAYDVERTYKATETGWKIEAMIPWHYICDQTRRVYVSERLARPLLRTFKVQEGAFLDATVCYLNGSPEKQYHAVYRTCTDNIGENFFTDSYNVRLTLGKDAQKPVQTQAPTDAVTTTGASCSYIVPAVIITVVVAAVIAGAIIIVKKRKK